MNTSDLVNRFEMYFTVYFMALNMSRIKVTLNYAAARASDTDVLLPRSLRILSSSSDV